MYKNKNTNKQGSNPGKKKVFKTRVLRYKPTLLDGAYVIGTTVLLSQFVFVPYLHAAPVGGDVVGGSGTINQSGLNTTIHQSTQRMAIDWQSYNVQQNERVQYIQPNARSVSLNRIMSSTGSQIHGQIDANGHVILVNPNGVFFSGTAVLNVGGIIASGLDINPTDFMNGNYIFNDVIGTEGKVINSGMKWWQYRSGLSDGINCLNRSKECSLAGNQNTVITMV